MDLQADRKTLIRWIRTFESTGSLSNIKPSSRNRSIRNEVNIDRVSLSFHEDDTVSTRKRATQLKISRSSLRRILKKYFKLFPYKQQLTQQLNDSDYASWLQFSRGMLNIIRDNTDVLKNLIMSDEARFHLSGYVNKQNFRIWAQQQPKQFVEKPLLSSDPSFFRMHCKHFISFYC